MTAVNETMAKGRRSEMTGKSPRILVVDDGITMRLFYRSVL